MCIGTEYTAIRCDAMVIQLQCYAMQYQTMEVNAQKRHPIITQHISCIPMCLFPSRCECFSFASTSTICAFVFLELLFKACRTRVCPVSVKNCSEHSSDLRCLQRKPFHCPLHLQKPFGQRSQQKSINIKIRKHPIYQFLCAKRCHVEQLLEIFD